MILHPEEWALLPYGRRYKGETDKSTMLPNGLGIIAIDDNHFYAGEFVGGKRHGRGFVIERTVEEREEDVWVNGTCEEVMATAHFDDAGRAISYDQVGHHEHRLVKHTTWTKKHDGKWDSDAYASDADLAALHRYPWKWAVASMCITHFHNGVPESMPSQYETRINEASAEGDFSLNGKAFVTPYDERHLLFCSRYGDVFVLADGEEHHLSSRYRDGKERGCFSFSLRIDSPDYYTMMSQCRFDELVQTALTDDSEEAQIYFLRVFYTRSSIFMLSPETLQLVKQAADQGVACAQFAYGRHLIITNPNEQSKDLSLTYFNKAQEQGLPDASAAISEAWQYGDFGLVDRIKAKQALNQSLQMQSEYGAVVQLKELVFGKNNQPETALDVLDRLIDFDAKRLTPYALWRYYKGAALYAMGNAEAAKKHMTYASNQGNIDAWFERAVYIGELNHKGDTADNKAYINALSEGAEHHNVECRTLLAWIVATRYDDLPSEEQTPKLAQEIIDELKECAHLGSEIACELIGDIYLNGWLQIENNVDEAWHWYAQAAIWHSPTAYEKMYAMAHDHEKDVDLELSDMLALSGARLGSKRLLAATVIAYTHGRLTEYASEIEQYFEPVFDDPDGFSLDDDMPYPDDDDPDDDGRFDAWA